MSRTVVFPCCYCQEILEAAEVFNVILLWQDGREQQWWCHRNCFVESLSSEARIMRDEHPALNDDIDPTAERYGVIIDGKPSFYDSGLEDLATAEKLDLTPVKNEPDEAWDSFLEIIGREEIPAILYIDLWSSRCGNCNKNCDPYESHHYTELGYNPADQGCGAKYTGVMSNYANMEKRVREMRPDLPYVGLTDKELGHE